MIGDSEHSHLSLAVAHKCAAAVGSVCRAPARERVLTVGGSLHCQTAHVCLVLLEGQNGSRHLFSVSSLLLCRRLEQIGCLQGTGVRIHCISAGTAEKLLLPLLQVTAEADNTSLPSACSPLLHFISNLRGIHQAVTSGSRLPARP